MTANDDRPVLFDAVSQLATVMEKKGPRHVFIGGIALAAWGIPRTTADIDIMIYGPEDQAERFIQQLGGSGFELVGEVEHDVMICGFLLRRHYPATGKRPGVHVDVDVLLSSNPLVEEIVERGRYRKLGDITIRVPSAEDFIVLKLQSGRMQDLADAKAVLVERHDHIDKEYLQARAVQFRVDELLERITSQQPAL